VDKKKGQNSFSFYDERKALYQSFYQCCIFSKGRIAVLDDSKAFVLFYLSAENKEQFSFLINDFHKRLKKQYENQNFLIGYLQNMGALENIASAVRKCERSIECGQIFSPNKQLWSYSDLGAFAWFEIPQRELENMLASYNLHIEDEKDREVLTTLKVYLNSNMNYSETADKLYLHINTVRKRIEKIVNQMTIDLNDPIERMKLTVLLAFYKPL